MLNFEEILSRDSYLLFIELRIFWLVSFGYGLAFIVFLLHHLTKNPHLARAGKALLWAAAVAHAAAILFRAFETGRGPFQSVYESLSWFACAMVFTYLYVSRNFKDVALPGTLVSALSGASSLYVLMAWSPAIKPLPPLLQSYWFEWHVPVAIISYAVLTVSACIEVSFLAADRALKKGTGGMAYGLSRETIEDFHSRSFNLVVFAFPLLTFVLFSGAVWSNEALGRYWNWGAKETWALITWTAFVLYLHSKTIPRFKDRVASAFNILGFFCIMITFSGPSWIARILSIPGRSVFPL
jgi:cytochrome c-type biogenesis protein CcsB